MSGASFAAYGRNPGCDIFWSASRRAYVAYRAWTRYLVALGGPGGEPEELDPLREQFRAWARPRGVAWYGAPASENPRRDIFIGQEAIVYPPTFALTGKKMQNLRTSVRAAERRGVHLVYGGWSYLPDWVRAQILAIDMAWEQRTLVKFGFSVSRFSEATSDSRPWVAACTDGRVEAFVTWLPGAASRGAVLDLMKRRQDAVPGAMDLLLVRGLEACRARGLEWVSLGVAASEDASARRGVSGRVGNMFNPASLRAYKQKFRPEWQDRWLVLPKGLMRRRMGLVAVAAVHLIGAPHNADSMLALELKNSAGGR
ncbi:MAG: phosphatidylglycerol lysyltransferase domain-containing protein [Candidatus Dormibacteraceae bacterium]